MDSNSSDVRVELEGMKDFLLFLVVSWAGKEEEREEEREGVGAED